MNEEYGFYALRSTYVVVGFLVALEGENLTVHLIIINECTRNLKQMMTTS